MIGLKMSGWPSSSKVMGKVWAPGCGRADSIGEA